MKKVLLLSRSMTNDAAGVARYKLMEDFLSLAREEYAELYYSSLDNLSFSIIGGEAKIFDHVNDCDLSEYGVVVCRNTHMVDSIDAFLSVNYYLEKRGVKVIGGLRLAGAFVGKLSQMYFYAMNGVPVPDTLASRRHIGWLIRQTGLRMPFIFKANNGIKGRDNYLLRDVSEAERLGEIELFVAQNFIENEGDYRVLYVGAGNEPLIFRRRRFGEGHLNNVAQGGGVERIDTEQFDEEALRVARQVMALASADLAGIDLIQDKTSKKWYVLETNTTPALESGSMKEEKVSMFSNFIKEIV